MGGLGRARLRSVASLNHVQRSDYVGFLLERGLLEEVEALESGALVPVLRTTEKGMEFVENLRFLDALLSSEVAFVSPLVGNGKVLVCASSRR